MSDILNKFTHFIGLDNSSVSAYEKFISALGGFSGILLIMLISSQFVDPTASMFIVASMGASSVLVFAIPHGKLSQPWSLFGGNLISAIIGVTCYQLIPDQFLAAGLAVGIAIGAMHLFNCIHPPGGATALVAVIGGPMVHELGYYYVITPILLNVTIIFLVAFLFNSLFPWRRYPASLVSFSSDNNKKKQSIDKTHIEQAVKDMDLIVDVTTDDLQQLFALTLQHANKPLFDSEQIKLGHYYTNGLHGPDWSVRHIIDESHDKQMVIYRIVEGQGLKSSGSCSRDEFFKWSAWEVYHHD